MDYIFNEEIVPKIQPIILAGGTGSRLWPLSRELYPKQLLSLTDETSLLQTTLLRVAELPEVLPPVIVVGEEHRFITLSQVEELASVDKFSILLESVGKNTAPAICGAAHFCKDLGDDVVLLVLPADHIVLNQEGFVEAVNRAATLAQSGAVVTFGIQPTSPETGYGYIEQGEGNSVASFKEKPDLQTAENYLEQGNYYWNSGMFIFNSSSLLDKYKSILPDIYEKSNLIEDWSRDLDSGKIEKLYRAMDSISIDNGIMEKTSGILMVPLRSDWSDLGSWDSLDVVKDVDLNGNIIEGENVVIDSKNSIIISEDKLIATIGVDNLVIVQTKDALLVCDKDRVQNIKDVVNILKESNHKLV